MRFRTIWTMPAMKLSERLRRTRDWFAGEVASALPLRVRYWVTMQMLAKVSMDPPNVPAMNLGDILKKLDVPKSMS